MRSKKVFKNGLSELLNQITLIIKGLIIPKLIISMYGSNINGLVISITNFLNYIVILEMGISPIIKAKLYKPISNNDKSKIEDILKSGNKFYNRIGFIFLIYILILLFIYPIMINNNNYLFIDSLIIVISLSTIFEYFLGIIYNIYLESTGNSYLISYINIFVNIFNTIAIIILIKLNCNIVLLKLFSSLIFIIKPLFSFFYVKYKLHINIKNGKDYKFNNKWDGVSQHIAWAIHNNIDIILLTLFSSLTNVSIYSIYSMICISVRNVIKAISNGIDAMFGNMIVSNEIDNLKNKFNMYELLYYIIISVVFICTYSLIIPFVKIYTINIKDANYVNYLFSSLIVISEFIYISRLPYQSLVLAGGYFKETKNGAWLECILNLIISILLVIKLGLIGVIIGTIIAMLTRTLELIIFSNKKILKRNSIISFKKIVLFIIESIISINIIKYIISFNNLNFLNWIINGFITFIISLIIVIIFNFIIYQKELKELIIYIKNIFNTKE